MLKVKNRENFGGDLLDNLANCKDIEHWQNYKKKVYYKFNSKGFRDNEWPDNLSDVIWCIGDSYTVGIGQPFKETWPQLLEKKIGKKCLNISHEGCSNNTIALRCKEIYKLYNPKLIIVMWSYLHRRKINNNDVHYNYEDRSDFGMKADIKNFKKNYHMVNSLNTKIINLMIPRASIDDKLQNLLKHMKNLIIIEQLDYARDGCHFDIKTTKSCVDIILKISL